MGTKGSSMASPFVSWVAFVGSFVASVELEEEELEPEPLFPDSDVGSITEMISPSFGSVPYPEEVGFFSLGVVEAVPPFPDPLVVESVLFPALVVVAEGSEEEVLSPFPFVVVLLVPFPSLEEVVPAPVVASVGLSIFSTEEAA